MNLVFRLALTLAVGRFRSRCELVGPVRTPFRVMPTDLDLLMHVNNGVYLSMLDLGRLDLMIRSRLLGPLRERRWYPVVTAESIRFRRPLTLFQRFHIETRVLGWDERSFYIEQRFLRRDDIMAIALVAGRFLGPDGSVPPADLVTLAGLDPEPPAMPDWAARLAGAQQELGG